MQKSGIRMLIVLVALIMTAAIATTTTFAWLQMSSQAEVTGVILKLVTFDGLLVSTSYDGVYVSSISGDSLKLLYDFDSVELNHLTPVLTNGNSATITAQDASHPNGQLMLEGLKYSAGGSASPIAKSNIGLAEEEIGNFFEFTLYFKAMRPYTIFLDMNLDDSLTGGATYIDSSARPEVIDTDTGLKAIPYSQWHNDFVAGTYGDHEDVSRGQRIDAKGCNAARIGMHNESGIVIYDPNSDQGYFRGNLAADIAPANAHTLYESDQYDNRKLTYVDSTGSSHNELLLTPLVLEQSIDEAGYYVGNMTISIWLEGKDGDCLNSVLGDVLDTQLLFKGVLYPRLAAVTYDSQGGSSIVGKQLPRNELIVQPVKPTRSGYNFDGWYTDTSYALKWDFGNDRITDNITLYAKWLSI